MTGELPEFSKSQIRGVRLDESDLMSQTQQALLYIVRFGLLTPS